MSKVVIDMTMSLDGFVAGPGDGKDYPLDSPPSPFATRLNAAASAGLPDT